MKKNLGNVQCVKIDFPQLTSYVVVCKLATVYYSILNIVYRFFKDNFSKLSVDLKYYTVRTLNVTCVLLSIN